MPTWSLVRTSRTKKDFVTALTAVAPAGGTDGTDGFFLHLPIIILILRFVSQFSFEFRVF